MAIIIPAAVLAAPAVCHMMRAKQEEETKTANQPDQVSCRSSDSQTSSEQEEEKE